MKVVRAPGSGGREAGRNYIIYSMISGEVSERVSIAVGYADGVDMKTRNLRSESIYYVLEGEMKVGCGGEEVVIGPGDSVFLESNIPYTLKGTFRALIINSPAFSLASEVSTQEE